MKSKLTKIAKVFLVLFAVAFVWVAFNFKHIRAFPKIISSYYAKEFCSCYFVVGQSEEFCHNYTRQYIPISKFQLDKEKKRVTVKGLFFTNSAGFVNDQDGCRYVER